MMSSSNKESKSTGMEPSRSRSILGTLRTLVVMWRRYIDLQSWAIAAYAAILLLTGNLFSPAGLILAGGILLTVILYCLDRWLATRE